MSHLKIKDFSNIYSPRNKSFTNTLPKTLNTTTKLNPPPTLTSRKSTSASRQYASKSVSPKIVKLMQVAQFKVFNKIRLGKQKMRQLNQTLQIQQKSQKAYQIRKANQTLYVNYDYNPISQTFCKKKNQNDKKKEKVEKPKTPNLIQAQMKNRDKNYIAQLKQRIDKMQSNAKILLDRIEKDKNRIKQQQDKKKRLVAMQKNQKIDQQQQLSINNSSINEFSDIIKIKQESYFKMKRDKQPFNIFELIKNPDKMMFKTGRQQLSQYYFCFDSMSNNSSALANEHFIRDISTYSRITIFNTASIFIPQNHRMTQINSYFEDDGQTINATLYLAKGLILPQLLHTFLNSDSDIIRKNSGSQLQSQFQQQNTCYKDNQEHKLTIYGGQNLQKSEIAYYGHQKLTKTQSNQIDLSTNYLHELKALLKKQVNMKNSSINDKVLKQKLQHLKEEILCKQMDGNISMHTGRIQIQRKIRMSKLNKNKTEKLKNMIVISTFRQKKSAEKILKETKKMKKKMKENM